MSAGEVLTYTNPRPAAEEGANAHLSEVGERRENTSPSTAFEGGCATGTTADGFARLKECAAEGVVWAGASTAERMRTLRVPPGFFI